MALEKVVVIDKIEVLESGHVQVREATKIMENGKEISKTYTNRRSFAPGEDVSNQIDRVKAIANVVWTKEVIANYKKIEAENAKRWAAKNK